MNIHQKASMPNLNMKFHLVFDIYARHYEKLENSHDKNNV